MNTMYKFICLPSTKHRFQSSANESELNISSKMINFSSHLEVIAVLDYDHLELGDQPPFHYRKTLQLELETMIGCVAVLKYYEFVVDILIGFDCCCCSSKDQCGDRMETINCDGVQDRNPFTPIKFMGWQFSGRPEFRGESFESRGIHSDRIMVSHS